MKKKIEEIKELRSLSVKDLNEKILLVREKIAKSRLEFLTNKSKDTNLMVKNRKLLARLLTIKNEKMNKKN